MRLLRWVNGWWLFIAAVMTFLACWLFALGATLYEQSLCTWWSGQPPDPGPGTIVVYVLIFGCVLAGAAGLIWGVTGLIVRFKPALPNRPVPQTGSHTGGRVTWLNGWRLLAASYIVGGTALVLVGDRSLIRGDHCLRWSSGAAIPDALYDVGDRFLIRGDHYLRWSSGAAIPDALYDPVLFIMYGATAVGLAGLIWGAVSFFVNLERRHQQRP